MYNISGIPESPEYYKLSSIRFNSTGDITGDIIFQQVIYHWLKMDKFTLKINTPAIPVIPGILYILLS
jgi:hypothetical protein